MDSAVAEVIASLPVHVPAGTANLPVPVAETPAARIQAFDEQMQRAGMQMTPAGKLQDAEHSAKLAAATAVQKHCDANGFVQSELMIAADLTFGYQLPAGIVVHGAQLYDNLETARLANFDQGTVDRFIAAKIKKETARK